MNPSSRWFVLTARHLAAALCVWALATTACAAAETPANNSPDTNKGGHLQKLKEAVGLEQSESNHIRLFDGSSLDHFYTWIDKQGTFVDPKGVFTVKDGVLRIGGEQIGFLATKAEYADYRLVAEFKWGEHIWLNKDKPKNSGICVHAQGLDKVWMKSIEAQISPGTTGDVVLLSGATMTAGGTNLFRPWSTFRRVTDKELEFPKGKWNVLEILCEGGRVQVKVNGHITVDGKDAYPNHGKILFQSNGAEIFFRRIDLFQLYPVKPASGKAGDKDKYKEARPASDGAPAPETK